VAVLEAAAVECGAVACRASGVSDAG